MENKIRAKLYYFYKKYLGARLRFSSFPYITGDTIRNYANHIFDDIKKFNPLKVKEGDKIFVKADMLEEFFKMWTLRFKIIIIYFHIIQML